MTTKTTKTLKTVAKKTTAKSKPSVKKAAPKAPRRKVTVAIAKAIRKMLDKQEAKEGRFNIAAVAREFGLSTVTIVNVQTNRYGYLPA
jgi:hypothetical protein